MPQRTTVEPAARLGLPFPEFVTMIASMMALTALSIDIMLPALPHIKGEFDTGDANNQQLVVTGYLFGFAIGQLFYGPLSDRWGRKPVLLTGLGLYGLASFLCMIANTFEVLLAERFLQGIACAAPRIIAIAVVRDVYGGRRMAEVMSFVMMVFIIVPVVAPSLGGGLLLAGSWHVIFGFLFAVALGLLAWTALRLPETQPPERREPMSVRWVAGAFGRTLSTGPTLGYTLAIGAVFGSLMSYVNSAEQVFTEVFDAGGWFPVLFGIAAGALAAAAFVNSCLVGRAGMRRLSHGALIGFTVTAAIHLGVAYLMSPPPLWLFMPLLGLDMFFFGFVMPNFNSLAMEPMGEIAGTASSFVGAVMTGLGAVLGWFVGQHYDGTVVPLLVGFTAFGTAALGIVLITERGRLFGTGSALQ